MKKLLVHRALHRATAVLLMLLLAVALPAMGRSEDPIRQARELVSNNRINEAILLLEQTVRENPERIVEAENLMRTIRSIRGEYNVLFELLIDNLVNNPEDITRTLELIDQMENLDEFPNQRVLRQVEDARVIAQLAYDRNIVNETMDRAQALLAADNYTDAIDLYLSLENLQRPEFESRGYGDIFVNRTNEAVARMQRAAQSFAGRVEPFREAARPVIAQAEENVADLGNDLFLPFLNESRNLAAIINDLENLEQDLIVLRSQVVLQFPEQPVEWYLNFQDMITRGRADNRDREGLLYATRRLYQDYLLQLVAITGAEVERELDRGLRLAPADRHDEAMESFTRVLAAGYYLERAEAFLVRLFEDEPALETIVENVDPERAGDLVHARAVRESAESLRTLSDTLDILVGTGTDRIDMETRPSLDDLRERKEVVRTVINRLRLEEDDWRRSLEMLEEIPPSYRPEETEALLGSVTDRRDAAETRSVERERTLAVRIADRSTEIAPILIASTSQELESIVPLLEGVEEPIETQTDDEEIDDSLAVRIVRYPDDALERLSVVENQLETAMTTVTEAREILQADADHVVSGEIVQTEITRLLMLEEQIRGLQNRRVAAASQADALITEAAEQREEGFERIADARTAISTLQVDAARNNYDAARDAFFESLELREDPDFREEADALIATLGRELLEMENVIVIQRVRELLTIAETQYNQDEYVAARDTLLQAQQTWEQTNVESNSEIDRLLLLATAALSLEEGRELTPTDPLYPVLGNYLSVAREDFNRGMALFQAGDPAADRYFDRSIQNLRNVRDVRPLNWDARILELRIVQVRDADEFEEIFSARYNQAVSRLDQVGPLEVYSELEALAEINPDYPGLQQQLRRLEIALNLRPDPIDQHRISEAQQLFQQAQNLAGGSRDQVVVAVSLLEDAVDLNPGHSNARFLLDQLRIRLGGQATASLSSTDEQQYRRAETLFQQGQVLQALAITERLLSNQANQGYPPLVELRRRIGLRLGI